MMQKPSILYNETDSRLALIVEKGSISGSVDTFLEIAAAQLGIYDKCRPKQGLDVGSFIAEIKGKGPSGPESDTTVDGVRDDTYYLDMVAFDVEDTLFTLPKYRLSRETDTFSVLFNNTLCGADATCMKLDNVAQGDFCALMKLMYPTLDPKALTEREWTSILRLSTDWKMLKIRTSAIEALDALGIHPADKVHLGRQHYIADWVKSGYVELVQRQEHLCERDIIKLGVESVVKICNIREQKYSQEWDTYTNRFSLTPYSTGHSPLEIFEQDIQADDDDGHDSIGQLLRAKRVYERGSYLYACEGIVNRREGLTKEEVDRLGWDTAVKLWEARLERRRSAWALVQAILPPEQLYPMQTVEQKIMDASAFGPEIAGLRVEGSVYALHKPPPIHILNNPGGSSESPQTRSSSPTHLTWVKRNGKKRGSRNPYCAEYTPLSFSQVLVLKTK